MKERSILRMFIFSTSRLRNSATGGALYSASAPRSCWKRAFLIALTLMRRKLATFTPGIAVGYWKARKRPACARSSGSNSRMFSPSSRISPSVTS